MSDQQDPQAGSEPTPTEELYQKRYNDLRPEYDRTQNELNRYQSDPEFRKQLFEELATEQGYEFDNSTDENYDPLEQLRAELRSEFQQTLTQRDQELSLREQAAYAQQHANTQLNSYGVEDDTVRSWIETRALAMPHLQDEEGHVVPDIEAAYKEYEQMMNAHVSDWGNTKRTTVAATEGQSNTGVPSWKNEEDPDKRREMRNAWAVEQMALRTQDQ